MTTFWSLLALAFATAFLASHRPRFATWATATLLLGLTYVIHFRILALEPEALDLERWGLFRYLAYVGLWVGVFLFILDAGLRLWMSRRRSAGS